MRTQFIRFDSSPLMAAVDAAPWDADGSSLQGSEIWGAHGEFARMRATRTFSYELAVIHAAEEEAPWAAKVVPVEGGAQAFESAADHATWQAQQ